MKLEEIISNYGVPDPKLVGKLPRGGMSLDFVGHADVTKMLIEVDPEWSWEPVAFDTDGLPAYRVENGMAHMAGWLTIHGVRRLGIGSVMHNKPDLLKELCSDFIRNASMRFGICLSLWTKQEWDDVAHSPSAPVPSRPKPQPVQHDDGPPPFTDDDYRPNPEDEPVFSKAEGLMKIRETTQKIGRAMPVDEIASHFQGSELVTVSDESKPRGVKNPQEASSPAQVGKLTALCINQKYSKQERLEMASQLAGRTIGDFKELRKGEASELISILIAAEEK
jgi:hypothetical protein